MEQEIILACQSGIKELGAILDYTEKIIATKNEDMLKIYTDSRLDELPHLQNLTVAITAMLQGESPKIAEELG